MPTVERSLQVRDNAVKQVKSIYETAISCKVTHSQLTLEVLRVFNTTLKHSPQWAREYVRGYELCLSDCLWKHLEFCYLVRTRIYSTHKDSERYYKKFDIKPLELKDEQGNFYWKDTNKIFY